MKYSELIPVRKKNETDKHNTLFKDEDMTYRNIFLLINFYYSLLLSFSFF